MARRPPPSHDEVLAALSGYRELADATVEPLGRGLINDTFTVESKAGSFVLQRTGVFEGGQAKESYHVIPGSATGELRGLSGDGRSAVGHGTEHPFTLDYELA